MSEDNDLFETSDARVWAERFVLRVTGDPAIAVDVDTMATWFAGFAGACAIDRNVTETVT